MGKKCLKCGYERQSTDTAPEYECPRCGAVYAKVEAAYGLAQGNDNHRPTKSCPYCGEEILAVAKKCKHCQSDLTQSPSSTTAAKAPAADYGVLLLAIPVISILLMWFWVVNMNLLQNPLQVLSIIGLSTIVITALIAAMEAGQVGMVSNKKQGTYSPIAWFFIILLLWIIGYTVYLFKRRKYGLTNFLIIGLIIAITFVASQFMLGMAIEQQKDKVRGVLGLTQSSQGLIDLQKDIEDTLDIYRLENGRYPSTSEGLNALVTRPSGLPNWKGPYLRGCPKTTSRLKIHNYSICIGFGYP